MLLSNAWDHEQRQRTLKQFGLDEVEFESRHEMLVSSLERGKISLDEYLERTIFYRPRSVYPGRIQKVHASLCRSRVRKLCNLRKS